MSYQNKHYQVEAEESVLDLLLRHQINIPYACKAGVCHVCVMQCKQGKLPDKSLQGLKGAHLAEGSFLACQCHPKNDLLLQEVGGTELFREAEIIQKDFLSEDVCRLKLHPLADLYYQAGQFIKIVMPNEGGVRSYSLASLPTHDDFLELHIKRMNNGLVSNWLFDKVQVGDRLDIQGPFGDCCYLPADINNKILLIATGTGLTPLIGVIREALAIGHKGEIYLYHGARHKKGLYLDREMRDLAATYANIAYFPCVPSDEYKEDGYYSTRASDLAFRHHSDLNHSLVYLCGSPAMVDEARFKAHLCGADISHIFTDPFITKDLRMGKQRDAL